RNKGPYHSASSWTAQGCGTHPWPEIGDFISAPRRAAPNARAARTPKAVAELGRPASRDTMIAAIRTAAALLCVIIFTPLGAHIGFPWTWITGSANVLYAIAMWITSTGLRVAGVRVQVEGKERINPAETYIYMSNHVSNLDPPILIPHIPRRSSVLVKKELFSVPILG